MKKISKILLSFLLLFSALTLFANAQEEEVKAKEIKTKPLPEMIIDDKSSEVDEKTQSLLDKIGFGKFVDETSTKEIMSFFKTFQKYMEKGNLDKLKSLYADDFVNNDGFNKDTYFDLIALVSDLYDDAKYTMNVVSVTRNGDFAYALVEEEANAVTADQYKEINGTGIVRSSSKYLYHLSKIGGKWKICGLDTLAEQTSLLYGDAKFLNYDIKAPAMVKEGSKYPISFTVSQIPDDALLIASLTNDPIVYPQKNNKEVFRTFKKKNNTLERIVTANKDRYNEYATASLGITRAGIAKGDDINMIKIYMTGMAFVMTRVNVEPVLNHKVEKPEKKADNGKAEE